MMDDQEQSRLRILGAISDGTLDPDQPKMGRKRRDRVKRKTSYDEHVIERLEAEAKGASQPSASVSVSDLVNQIVTAWMVQQDRGNDFVHPDTVRRVLLAALRELTEAGTWLRGSPRELLADLEMDEVTALELVERTVDRLQAKRK